MSNNKNQHYVPQYYFRNFSTNKKSIQMLLKKDGSVIQNVSIKNQCSKNNFYLIKKLEHIYSSMEKDHSKALKEINNLQSIKDYPNISQETNSLLYQMILFQKNRTLNFTDTIQSFSTQYIKTIAKEHIKSKFGDKIPSSFLNELNIDFKKKYFPDMMNKMIGNVLFLSKSIRDLNIYILNNKTNREFIFSDDPVIFYNLAYRHIKDNSMIALQSPGLMIFYPISKDKCLLFLDEKPYTGSLLKQYFFNITKDTDIDTINKLQIHNCLNSIYTSSDQQIKFIKKLYRQEKNNIKLMKYNSIISEGKNTKSLMIVQEKMNFKANLSFISSSRQLLKNQSIYYRDKELYQHMKDSNEMYNDFVRDAQAYKSRQDKANKPYNEDELRNLLTLKLLNMYKIYKN